LISKTRNRTSFEDIAYGLYLYFLGLSFRNASKALSLREYKKGSHVAIWKWVQSRDPKELAIKEEERFLNL
jgi:hypothetical protein